MRFFGQFGEDAALWGIFHDKKDGYFVDIGALDGVGSSNTLIFERAGWHGICVEPHSRFYPLLVKNRKQSICLNCAVWDENLESVDFHETLPGGWSRVGSPGKREVVRITHPETRTLNSILDEHHAPPEFELLSIDVEGTEWHILEAFDLCLYLPRVVIIEDLLRNAQFDSFFSDYFPVYSWKQGKAGSNVIYCREYEDYEIIKQRWRG